MVNLNVWRGFRLDLLGVVKPPRFFVESADMAYLEPWTESESLHRHVIAEERIEAKEIDENPMPPTVGEVR